MMNRLTVLFVMLLAACGGKSAPDPTTPAGAGDGHTDHDHAAGGGGQAMGDPATPPAPVTEAPPGGTSAPPDPAKVKADLLAAEHAAYEKAKPVFGKYCAKCHSKDSKKATAKALGHFDMTSYPLGGHHAMEASAQVRKALAIGGGKPTMPMDQKGAVQGDELALIAAWADAFDQAHQGGAHDGAAHGGGHKP